MKTDTSEKGLETLIMRHMTGVDGLSPSVADQVAEASPRASGTGWIAGYAGSYDREYAVDAEQVFAFHQATEPDEYAKLGIGDYKDKKTIARTEREIALMQEYRTRLTADVVTGRLDVPPAAHLSDITADTTPEAVNEAPDEVEAEENEP